MTLGFPVPFELGCIKEFFPSGGKSYVYMLESAESVLGTRSGGWEWYFELARRWKRYFRFYAFNKSLS